MIEIIPIVSGMLTGVVVWWFAVRPHQLRTYERERRRFGLPPERRLPEDG